MIGTFEEYLEEKVLSIGFNPAHEHHREKHRQEIHDILHKSYARINGYNGHKSGSPEESHAIHHDITHSNIKATKRDGKISSVNLYKDSHGRKSIASGTDGSERGKDDIIKTKHEDKDQVHRHTWGEASGSVKNLHKRIGTPVVHSKHAEHLTGKSDVKHIDHESYTRKIGGHEHEKTIFGNPKLKA